MSPLLIPAAIEWAVLIAAVVAMVRELRIDAGMHPRRGEGEQQGAGDVNAELNRAALPTRMVCDFHTNRNRTQEQRNHG